jgi:phosphate transport system substrate-binding protein
MAYREEVTMRRTTVYGLLLLVWGGLACKKNGDNGSGEAADDPAAPAASTALIRVDGSSTVFPITEAVAEEFQKSKQGSRVTVGVSGTGGGFEKFCAGETDVANASRPVKPAEVERCRKRDIGFVELPVAYDGLAILVNPKNDWAKHITVTELKKLWEPEAQRKITRWSQVRADWPNEEIHLFGAGVDSGTYDYFTEAVVGKEHASRGDFTSSEDDNVIIQGIAGDRLALGFVGYGYYSENKDKLRLVPVDDGKEDNGKGPISPSPETVKDGTYQPLSRPVFIYVSAKALDKPEVARFVGFYLDKAGELVEEVGYVPLPAEAYKLAKGRVAERMTGSLFGGKGSQVGVSLEELLKKERPATN